VSGCKKRVTSGETGKESQTNREREIEKIEKKRKISQTRAECMYLKRRKQDSNLCI